MENEKEYKEFIFSFNGHNPKIREELKENLDRFCGVDRYPNMIDRLISGACVSWAGWLLKVHPANGAVYVRYAWEDLQTGTWHQADYTTADFLEIMGEHKRRLLWRTFSISQRVMLGRKHRELRGALENWLKQV